MKLLPLIIGALAAASPAYAIDMLDFLRMDVCASNPAAIPGEAGCTGRREATVNDASLHYVLREFPSNDYPCLIRDGKNQKLNVPVQWQGAGNQRIGSFYDAGQETGPNCPTASPDRGAFESYSDTANLATDRMSLHWAGANHIFIMASGSDEGFSYYIKPNLCQTFPNQSQKYYDGWILAPRNLNSGDAGWTINTAKLYNGKTPGQTPDDTWGTCPSSGNTGFTNYVLTTFGFHNGVTYEALINDHYAQGTSGVGNPGGSQSKERTYFADEFGLVRWEAWKRSDYVDSSGRTAAELAKILYQKGRCNKPYDMPANTTADMSTGAVTYNTTGWYEDITSKDTNTTKRWYMTQCADYTNFRRYGRSVVIGTPDQIPSAEMPGLYRFFQ